MSDRDLKFVYLFCQTSTFLFDVKYSERDRTVRYGLLAISALSYTEKHLIEKNYLHGN